MKFAINASRARSGGAFSHLLGVISALDSSPNCPDELHIWTDSRMLDFLPDFHWLYKHKSPSQSHNIFLQLLWEALFLPFLIKSFHCDMVINVDAGTVNLFSPSITMSRDMLPYEPGVLFKSSYSISFRMRLFLLRFITNRSLLRSDGVVFLTNYAAQVIQNDCGKCLRSALIPHGVSSIFKKAHPKDLSVNIASSKIHCLYVSNLLPYKHHAEVVKAIASLQEDFDITIDFVGGGSSNDIKALQELSRTEGLKADSLRIHPFIPQSQLPNFLCNADIFIFASSCENMPNTLVEAMSVGLPIVCSDRGPMPEILRDGGLYFNPENPLSLSSALRVLISSHQLRHDLAFRACSLSHQYNWEKCANDLFGFATSIYNSRDSSNKY